MMDRFLDWLGFDRSRASRSLADRSRVTVRRLAVEPIEDRLLLSATGGESVADGGTVSLTFGMENDCVFSVAAPSGLMSGTTDQSREFVPKVAEVPDSGLTVGEFANSWSSERGERAAYRGEELQGYTVDGVDGRFDASSVPSSGNSIRFQASELSKPESEELDPGEFPPPESDSGTISVAYMAHQKVFAEIGSSGRGLDGNDWRQTAGQVELALLDTPDAVSSGAVGGSYRSSSLAGSQGRLTGFDLAMGEKTPEWSAGLEAVKSGRVGKDLPATGRATDAAATETPKLPTVSNVQYDVVPVARDLSVEAHRAALDGMLASSSNLPIMIHLPELDESAESATLDATAEAQTPGPEGVVDAHAVCLDQRREKPVAHLAAAVGIGHVLLGDRRRSVRDVDYEQLPPRKR